VAGISVDQEEDVSREQVLIEWWVHTSLNDPQTLEFLPSYCDAVTNACQNATSWTKGRKYEIGSEKNLAPLRPFTKYVTTVYVRKDGVVYNPAIHKAFTTVEGGENSSRITVFELKTILYKMLHHLLKLCRN
jgi:hypothetical protein